MKYLKQETRNSLKYKNLEKLELTMNENIQVNLKNTSTILKIDLISNK